jgi:DNA repair protein RadC
LPHRYSQFKHSTSKERVKIAILSNSASTIVDYDHLSSAPTPSKEDVEVTKTLVEAAGIVGILLLNHPIVCEEKVVSLEEKGKFEWKREQ